MTRNDPDRPCDGCAGKSAPPSGGHQPAIAQRRTSGDELTKCGILNIYKQKNLTSHDVVAAVRRASGVRRVGHAGTLDPLATGVLVVCLGSATRVIEEIQNAPKTYRAVVGLGRSTDTYDAEGRVTAERDPSAVTRAQIAAALEQFQGDILQKPPMYSAVRHQGKRLYELARSGQEVERSPRPVTVHRIDLLSWAPPELALELEVSKGTYIRAIAHELGDALDIGGYLADLERTAVGRFVIGDAQPLDRVTSSFCDGWWMKLLQPLDNALLAYDAILLDAEGERAVRSGQQVSGPAPADNRERLRAYSIDGTFVALLRWDHITEKWQPHRVFPRPR